MLAGPPDSGVPGAWRMFTLTLPEPPLLRARRGEFPSSLEEAVNVAAVGVDCPGTLSAAMSRTPRGSEEAGSCLVSTAGEAVADPGEGDEEVAATAAMAAEPALLTWAEDDRGLALAWEIPRPSTNMRRSSWYAALGLCEELICCRCWWLVLGVPEHMLPPATSSVQSEASEGSVPGGTRAPRPPSCPPSRRGGRYSFPA